MIQRATSVDDGISDDIHVDNIDPDQTVDNKELNAGVGVSQPKISEEGMSPSPTKELKICKLFATWPKLFFSLTLSCHLLLIFMSVILYIVGYEILPIDFSDVPLNLEDDPTKLRADAWKFASESDAVTLSSSVVSGSTKRVVRYQVLELVYESQEDNVLTKTDLKQIQTFENELQNNTIWERKLCLLNPSQTCQTTSSILRFFDGTYRNFHKDLFDPNFENIHNVLETAQSLNKTRSILAYHLGKDAIIRNETARSRYTRSLMTIAWPLDGFNSTLNKKDEQMEKLNSLTVDAFAQKLKDTYKSGLSGIQFYYYNRAIYVNEIKIQVVLDFLLAGGSMVFIFMFMWLQIGSLWITSWAIFSILSSFVITNFIYRVILDFRYFGVFHVLSVFIVLGIGADDVFVFMDSWKSTAHVTVLITRLSEVYSHAASAMFVTSFTTMVAFLSSSLSPLLAVSTFGTFSALLVAVNYLSVVLFLPCVVIIHELYLKTSNCCVASFPCTNSNRNEPNNCSPCCSRTSNTVHPVQSSSNLLPTEPPQTITQKLAALLQGPYFKCFVGHRKIRWFILLVFAAILATFLAFATFIKPDEKQVDMWVPGTNWYEVKRLRESAFRPSEEDNIFAVHIIWGLKEQDRTNCHFTDYKCKGKTVFDTSFDLNPPPCQNAALSLCQKLKDLPRKQQDALKIRRSLVSDEVQLKCLLARMREYFEVESNKSNKYPLNTNLRLPVNAEKMGILMKGNPQLYNKTALPETYYRYFELALGYFITDGLKPDYWRDYDFQTYSQLVGGEKDPSALTSSSNLQGNKYGNRLLFMAIAVNTTLSADNLGYERGLPIYNEWESFVKDQMKEMPPSCRQGFQATVDARNAWHWIKVQQILVRNAVQGIVLGLCLALVILTVATMNWMISLLATLTIGLITCCVVGVIPMAGWKLGILESLNLTLVVGLSVDYVVHLAQGYVTAQATGRLERVQSTLGHVGISVLSGACSTLGASIFMFGAKILFFFQFGIFIFSTVGFSLVFSLVFFVAVLGLVGPVDNAGSLSPWVGMFVGYLRGRTKTDVDCKGCRGKGFVKKDT
ncbi:protein dispatched homolog 3-like [Dendronephthya gigantea]|uniref:protein dispatched homolog 3-like n=1 Tax=Dendronephthya gigantea TaxID=151771 RepID=UPI00106C9C3C|nr:protein dispatched homolog 3-like [Dendronephthya gigantea]